MPNKKVTLPTPDVIAQAVDPDEAIEFWRSRAKLTSDDAEALGDDARHRAFYVSGLARHDLVQLVSDGIEEALKSGETLADFKKRILEAIQTQGWHDYRVENIFRTNVQTAYAAGRYVKMQAVKDSRPYWQYIAIMDSRVRPSHAVMNGKVYPADHAFWATNYPPNGFRCRCGVRTLSERQLKRQGLTVEKNMPRDGGADKGFRNNPGKDWAEAGLNLNKYPQVNAKSHAQQRGPATNRPAHANSYAELEQEIKSRLAHFATNNGVTSVSITRASYFMATDTNGNFMISERNFQCRSRNFNPAKLLLSAWNKLSGGKPLTWEEEYACESLWHEITHNREIRGPLPKSRNSPALRYMETVTQWTARRTYHRMLKSLGGKAAHQDDIKKNGLGYGLWIRNFDRLLDVLKVQESVLLPELLDMIATRPMNEYGQVLVEILSRESGIKKSVVRAALSGTGDPNYDQILRSLALI